MSEGIAGIGDVPVRLFRIGEAHSRLKGKLPLRTFYELVRRGEVPGGVKLGGIWYIGAKRYESWLRELAGEDSADVAAR